MRINLLFIVLFLLIVTLGFFYPIFKGYSPFPGDLLVSNAPYSSYSYLGYAPGGVPNKGQGFDVMEQSFPWKFFTIDSWKKGQIPFWNPYNFSGNPHMANFQSGVFYPINGIFFFLPFFKAWTVYIFLAPFLAGVFCYLFLQEIKLTKISSIFGGIVFAFSSYMVVWLEYGNITHTFLWLPLVLYFTERYLKKERWYDILFITFSLWFSFLAGYIQGFFYLLIVVMSYVIAKSYGSIKEDLQKIVIFFLAIIFAIGMSLFQLFPTLSLFSLSTRSDYTLLQITHLLNPWWYTITVFIPDFFGNQSTRNYWFPGTYIERTSYFGLIPFLLSLSVLFNRQRRETLIFSILFIISFLLAIDLYITRYIYVLPISILSTTVPTRILGIFCFSGAILSAIGMDLIIEKKGRKRLLLSSIIGFSIIIAAWVFVNIIPMMFKTPDWKVYMSITKHNLLFPTLFTLIFFVIVQIRFTKIGSRYSYNALIVAAFLTIVTIGDLFYFFHKITPFSLFTFVYPKTDVILYLQEHAGIYRFWGYGKANILSNFQMYDKTYTSNGYDALHIKTYSELQESSLNGSVPKDLSRSTSNIVQGYGVSELTRNSYRQKILNITGVKYILAKNEDLTNVYQADTDTFPTERYQLIWQKPPWQIYENLRVTPRIFLTDNYIVIKDKKETIKMLLKKDFDEQHRIILNVDPKLSIGYLSKKNVQVLSYQQSNVTVKTDSDANALLFISDNNYPGWRVTIDGKESKIYTADYTFRAVSIEKGKHMVIFSYYPQSFDLGWKASILAFISLLITIAIFKKRNILA